MEAIFEKYPDQKPSYNDIYYLTIIFYLNHYSYSFNYFDGENFHLNNEGEIVVGFSETDPKELIILK